MHAHMTEIVTEARLEEGAGGRIEWLAGGAKDIVDDLWNFGSFEIIARPALEQPFLLRTLRALAAARVCSAGALTLQEAGWRR
jgi:hypothetical protein